MAGVVDSLRCKREENYVVTVCVDASTALIQISVPCEPAIDLKNCNQITRSPSGSLQAQYWPLPSCAAVVYAQILGFTRNRLLRIGLFVAHGLRATKEAETVPKRIPAEPFPIKVRHEAQKTWVDAVHDFLHVGRTDAPAGRAETKCALPIYVANDRKLAHSAAKNLARPAADSY
jgi:hypothetical protein